MELAFPKQKRVENVRIWWQLDYVVGVAPILMIPNQTNERTMQYIISGADEP